MYNFRAYTGIGSRKTPLHILEAMESVARFLADQDWTLRSGAAHGADTAFEIGATEHNGRREIYLPWSGFNGHASRFNIPLIQAFNLGERFHPAWSNLSQGARLIMARNAHQLLGNNLNSPSSMVICWTYEGQITGGTGQALRMAQHYGVPVINLGSLKIPQAEKMILEIHRQSYATFP